MSVKLKKFTSQNGEVIYLPRPDFDPYVEKKNNKARALLIKCPLPNMSEEDISQMKKDLNESKRRLRRMNVK
jgi:hypothetical protein